MLFLDVLTYHRWRILSLMIAMACLVWGILRQC